MFGSEVEDKSFGLGYQVVYEYNPALSIDLSDFWHQDHSLSLGNQLPVGVHETLTGIDVVSITLNGRIGFRPTPNYYGYVGAGFGYYIPEADNQELRQNVKNVEFIEADIDKDFGAQTMIGLEVVLTRHWECFLELRKSHLDTGLTIRRSSLRTGHSTTRNPFNYDHMTFRIGLNYRI